MKSDRVDWRKSYYEEAEKANALAAKLAGMEAAWMNACKRGDAAVARLAEARQLLDESLEADGGIPDKASPDSLNGRIYRFLTADKGDAAHD